MRTTINLPDELLKQAKIKAVQEGISLKELFIRSLERELDFKKDENPTPWKELSGMGSASKLAPKDSGFDGYRGPE